jgi:hypothetical protein
MTNVDIQLRIGVVMTEQPVQTGTGLPGMSGTIKGGKNIERE